MVGMFGDVRMRATVKGYDWKNMNKEYGSEQMSELAVT